MSRRSSGSSEDVGFFSNAQITHVSADGERVELRHSSREVLMFKVAADDRAKAVRLQPGGLVYVHSSLKDHEGNDHFITFEGGWIKAKQMDGAGA